MPHLERSLDMTTHDARAVAHPHSSTRAQTLRRLALHFIVPAALVVAAGTAATSAHAQVSVTINPPGVYGRIVLGGLPPPPLLFPQPVIVRPVPVAVHAQPVYLYVPQGHARDWHHHCHRYQACNQRVYFVREEWVRERHAMARGHHHHHHGYKPAPVYRGYGDRDDHGRGHGYGKGRGHDRDRG
jgi:hypothetical protein